MIDLALGGRRRGHHGSLGRRLRGWLLAPVGIAAALVLAGAPVAYMLWPQATPVATDAPALPITVGGVTFNVPPAAIRMTMQRRPGTQSRIDLAFVWPALTPPPASSRNTVETPAETGERLFLTIAASDGTLPPLERFKLIYPRYAAASDAQLRDGLTMRDFRLGTPYQGEQLVYDAAAPERFLLRCSHAVSSTPGICLNERRIGGADVTARFPRDWLSDWRNVADRIERLLARMRPAAG